MAPSARGEVGQRSEVMWFTFAAVAFVILEIAGLGAWAMITRPLWLDELHTYLIATQSLPESIRSLAAGADFNPPAIYFLYRAVAVLTGDLSAVTARVVASACVLGALTTAYILLRDQFSPWPAAIGTLAVWAQQVVMHAAFEARFYGPLLLASGCLLVAMRRSVQRPPTPASAVWLAVTSVLVCTVHYFGVLSWGIGIVSVLLFAPGSRAEKNRRLLPSIAGPLALAACMPLYFGQVAALTVPTWIPEVTVIQAARLLAIFVLTLPLAVALLCWGLTQAQAWRSSGRAERFVLPRFSLGPLLLLAQVAVPVTLVAFSLIVLPATENRYWIVGAFAPAPVVAFVVSRADVLVRWIATIGIVAASVKTMRGEANRADAFAQRVRDDVRVSAQFAGAGALVVARWRDTLYPVLRDRPDLRSHMAVLDSSPFDPTNRFFAVERDVAHVHRRRYGFPTIVTPADLSGVASFYLIEPEREGEPTTKEFPRHAITRVADRVFHLVLRSPSDS